MDVEELSKSQIILLTLLVSFVTSIATGIVTVSLMGQAPPSIAQNVNRIVERTVERVVPAGQTASSVVTREQTVIVKESELISGAVQHVSPSIVRLYSSNSEPPIFLGFGVVLDASGAVATDADALGENGDATLLLPDGTHVRAFVTSREKYTGVVFMRSATTTTEGKSPVWNPATISVGHAMLGETVIALSGKNIPRIADGIAEALVPLSAEEYRGTADIIDTNVATDVILPGVPLVNTDGEIIGLSTGVSRSFSSSSFISGSALVKQTASPGKASVAPPK